ncbi:hypothetical protein [Clostridium saccharobutylicum]|uniref:Uncharacterized protein n=1 Tax=Clostridium saccharobutylicum TaxID=169679 RepID=A0A1S8MZ17_CLOSA|nr:hypothetical protein [Clostridium saccharobutylicum]OOM09419.1 hypothetical protein CLOSAC_37000 [Clostridium saccharobutylicum]
MSNHSGSYMLNEVLCKMKSMDILKEIGKEKSHEFALAVIKIGRRYDSNNGEILEDVGRELGICYCCLEETYELDYSGLCKDCGGEFD